MHDAHLHASGPLLAPMPDGRGPAARASAASTGAGATVPRLGAGLNGRFGPLGNVHNHQSPLAIGPRSAASDLMRSGGGDKAKMLAMQLQAMPIFPVSSEGATQHTARYNYDSSLSPSLNFQPIATTLRRGRCSSSPRSVPGLHHHETVRALRSGSSASGDALSTSISTAAGDGDSDDDTASGTRCSTTHFGMEGGYVRSVERGGTLGRNGGQQMSSAASFGGGSVSSAATGGTGGTAYMSRSAASGSGRQTVRGTGGGLTQPGTYAQGYVVAPSAYEPYGEWIEHVSPKPVAAQQRREQTDGSGGVVGSGGGYDGGGYDGAGHEQVVWPTLNRWYDTSGDGQRKRAQEAFHLDAHVIM